MYAKFVRKYKLDGLSNNPIFFLFQSQKKNLIDYNHIFHFKATQTKITILSNICNF